MREHVAEKTEGTSRRRVKTTAHSLPQEKAEPRFRSISENPGPRTIPKLGHLRMSPAVVNAGTGLGLIPQSPDSDVFQQTPKSEVPQQHPRVIGIVAPIFETPPSKFFVPRGRQCQMLKCVYNSTGDQENVLRGHVNS